MTTIENIAIIVLTALALAFFIVVFVRLAKEGRDDRKRKRNDRIAEEATAIIAALCAYDQIKETKEGLPKEKEVSDEENKAV